MMFRDQMYQCPVQTLPLEREWKSNAEIAPNCPRCASPNTKFCYYNNYSSSQPRYFCKGCRRYWTRGGSLRNVPVGGGSCRRRRKNRRARSLRLPHDPRVSDNSSKNFSGFSSDSKVPDIDLAVVFTKFLNDDRQELGTTPTAETGSVIDGSKNSTRMDSNAMIGCQQKPFDNNLLEEDEDDRVRDLLELETWLRDGAVEDESLLSDSPVAGLPDFTWQPMLQFQEDLDCFPTEHDQLKTSASLINDHWTCFDLSGFEIYSRP